MAAIFALTGQVQTAQPPAELLERSIEQTLQQSRETYTVIER